MCTRANGLEYHDLCRCAGTFCGGRLVLNPAFAIMATMTMTPIGWQGVAQHTYTPACAGHHAPGPCPPSQQPVRVEFGG